MQAFLNKWFPQKHNLVLATFASYVGIYGVIKICKGNPQPEKPVKAVKVVKVEPVTVVQGGYVAPTADNIGTWLDNPQNLTQWEKSL